MAYRILASGLLGPTLDYLRGTRVLRCAKVLRRSQWLSREEILRLRKRKLRGLIRHAYLHVPFYHQIFRSMHITPQDIKNVEDLCKLPILTKEDIKSNFHSLIARNYPPWGMALSSTGGSMGDPLIFYTSKESNSWGGGAAYRAYEWAGYHLGDKHMFISGSFIDLSSYTKLSKKIENAFERCKVINAHEISGSSIEVMERFKPEVIIGYASGIYLLARIAASRGLNHTLKAVITTAEKLYDWERKEIEDIFGCDVYDFYGSREVLSMAAECSEHNGYHISDENVILEFVSGNEYVSEGEMGAILVTDLNNYVMPFIRYKNGDMGEPLDELCNCGRSLSLMKSVEGRIADILVTVDGKFISPPLFTLIFKDLRVKYYQIVQNSLGEVRVKIVKDKGYSQSDIVHILKNMKKILGEHTNVKLQYVDEIHPSPSGKRRVVISKITHKYI